MTCPNCERLQAQLDLAKKELTFRGLDLRVAALIVRLGTTPVQSKLLLAIYDGGSKPQSAQKLIDALETGDRKTIHVHINRIRDSLGEGFIQTHGNGDGYTLSVPAMSMCLAALEPVDLQPVRP